MPNLTVGNRDDLDANLACVLTKTLFDRKARPGRGPRRRPGRLELKTAPEVAPLELHPGAKRYYDEQAKT